MCQRAELQQGMQAALEFESMNGIILYMSNSGDRHHAGYWSRDVRSVEETSRSQNYQIERAKSLM